MSTSTSYAFWITGPEQGEIRETTLPPLESGTLQVRALYSGISRGTESLVWRGQVPGSQHRAMRAPFQEGEFPAPVKYGYCNVGVVEDGPADWIGQRVFCLYPHQTRYRVPIEAVHPLPEGLDPANAVLAANTETAINATWDAGPMVGERIAVIGAGVVGALTAALCTRIPGVEVQLVDVNLERGALAEALGVPFATPESARGELDRIIHASGHGEGLRLALSLAAMEATVVELSWFGSREPTVPLGEDFHARRLTLRSSQVGSLNPLMRPRWDHRRRLNLALQLLTRHPEWAALVDAESDFPSLPATMPSIAGGSGLCHRIRYQE